MNTKYEYEIKNKSKYEMNRINKKIEYEKFKLIKLKYFAVIIT